ncbi:hypothetical protein [Massilia endophytica]|uniref:hypothetical protein n=1 Tax=Massilia endophytica TaxID=2899220 RepID=UPI001E5C50DA|nr:hypothetical protein [Massilia endophytica]UGQ48425.1 hypothetical protein LSQ66_08140 [Massilia endophytica]
MASLTLVVPFGLPPAEFAPDLVRSMQAPSLAALLSRNKSQQYVPFDVDSRVLPHEAWLAQAPGAPLASAVMRGMGMEQEAGHWFIVHPIHVQIARNHLVMQDPRQLRLEEADSRTLFESVQQLIADEGKTLLYGNAHTWFLRADEWAGLATASPDAASGVNLADWMPTGDAARSFRRLQNEVQMLWHEHPVNEARAARKLPAVNSFWLWAGSPAPAAAAPSGLAVIEGPDWMNALASGKLQDARVEDVLAKGRSAVLAQLLDAGLSGDWSSWLLNMQDLDQQWFAPVLEALRAGRIDEVTLILSHRDGWTEFRTGRMSLRRFWRPVNLKKLST